MNKRRQQIARYFTGSEFVFDSSIIYFLCPLNFFSIIYIEIQMSSAEIDSLSLDRLHSDVINMIIGIGIEFVDIMKLVRPVWSNKASLLTMNWFFSSDLASLEHARAWLYQLQKASSLDRICLLYERPAGRLHSSPAKMEIWTWNTNKRRLQERRSIVPSSTSNSKEISALSRHKNYTEQVNFFDGKLNLLCLKWCSFF